MRGFHIEVLVRDLSPSFTLATCPSSRGPAAQQMCISVDTHPCGYIKHTQDMSPEPRKNPMAPLLVVLLPGMGPAVPPQQTLTPESVYT